MRAFGKRFLTGDFDRSVGTVVVEYRHSVDVEDASVVGQEVEGVYAVVWHGDVAGDDETDVAFGFSGNVDAFGHVSAIERRFGYQGAFVAGKFMPCGG